MSRVKRGVTKHARHRKIVNAAKGYYGTKSRAYRVAKQAVDRSRQFAYRDRRQKKRNFRGLWIIRINAAARLNGLSYNRFIDGLNKAGSEINRKMLADLAVRDPQAFTELAELAKKSLAETQPESAPAAG